MIEESIAAIFGALLILEGLLVAIMPKQTLKLAKKLLKDQKKLWTIGIIEAIVGIAIMFLVLYY